jgi:hypothetical protein
MNRKKLHAAALVLPLLGGFLLLSPMIHLFAADAETSNVSGPVAYVFAVWIGLIALAAVLARALVRAEPLDEPIFDESEPGP